MPLRNDGAVVAVRPDDEGGTITREGHGPTRVVVPGFSIHICTHLGPCFGGDIELVDTGMPCIRPGAIIVVRPDGEGATVTREGHREARLVPTSFAIHICTYLGPDGGDGVEPETRT